MEFCRKLQMKVSYRWLSERSCICKEQSPSIMVTENCYIQNEVCVLVLGNLQGWMQC
jgi:hypothetical protein